jgi:hypothetical protein
MLTTLLQLVRPRSPAGYERAFIHDVHVKAPMARNPWVERLLLAD